MSRMNESCNVCDLTQVLSRIKSWHTFEWVMSHIWMSRVTHISLTTQAPSRTKSAAAFSASTTPMHRCVWVWESLCLSVCLSVLSVCLSVCLSIYPCGCLSVCLSICLSAIYLSSVTSVCLCDCVSVLVTCLDMWKRRVTFCASELNNIPWWGES